MGAESEEVVIFSFPQLTVILHLLISKHGTNTLGLERIYKKDEF